MWNRRPTSLIGRRVMERVQQLIEAGEAEYEDECARIDREADAKKDDAADRIVNGILRQ